MAYFEETMRFNFHSSLVDRRSCFSEEIRKFLEWEKRYETAENPKKANVLREDEQKNEK